VDKTVAMLADARIARGAVHHRRRAVARRQHEPARTRRWRDYLPVALAKLLVHPLLVWCVGAAAIALGVPLSPSRSRCWCWLAALPSASNVSLLAERYGADNGRVARIILAAPWPPPQPASSSRVAPAHRRRSSPFVANVSFILLLPAKCSVLVSPKDNNVVQRALP
jgi:hypothetical protein